MFALLPLASIAGEDRDSGQESPSSEVEQTSRRAHALFREAEAAFQDGRYESALENYLEAYALLPRPGLHARIGACHRELGDHQSAVERFERFLIEAPNAANRGEVEASLAESRAAVDAQLLPLAFLVGSGDDEGSGSDDFSLPLVALTATDPPPVPATETIDPSIPPAREQPAATPSPPEWARVEPAPEIGTRDRPAVYERWWFWAAVGATAAAAGGAAYAGTRQEPVLVLPSGSLGSADWR